MKREYVKPEMKLVHLKAEEAVLTSCKNWSNSGTGAYFSGDPTFGNCNKSYGGGVERCSTLGS